MTGIGKYEKLGNKSTRAAEKESYRVTHELNELDWKEGLSSNHEKLSNHLSAFANNPGGGFLVFGIDNKTRLPVGINTHDSERVITTLSNRARGTLNPEVIIEHSHFTYQEYNLLVIFIHESTTKPVHMKKGTIERWHDGTS